MTARRLCLITISLLILCSCSELTREDEQSNTATTIITFAAPESEMPIFKPIIDRFNSQHSINVHFVSLDDVYTSVDKLSDPESVLPVVTAADTAKGFVKPSDILKRYVSNLKPFIDSDPSFNITDYYPISLSPISNDGGIYALPDTIYNQWC